MNEDLAKKMTEALSYSLRTVHSTLRANSFNRWSAGLARADTFPGAACCQDLRSYTRGEEYGEVFELYAKAAPLRALRHSRTP